MLCLNLGHKPSNYNCWRSTTRVSVPRIQSKGKTKQELQYTALSRS